MLEGKPKLVAIDEETNHQIVHGRRFGKADCAAHQTLHAGPQIDVLAFDLLRVLFAHDVLLGIDMSLVGPPPIRVQPRDPKRLQEGFALQKNGIHLPDIMPPKVETFTRCTSHPRNGHATCSLWRCPSCLPCSAPLPASRAGSPVLSMTHRLTLPYSLDDEAMSILGEHFLADGRM
jgi:hypothetical protein